MRKIGIFGGTFNPVHNEHIEVAVSAVEELGLDKLYVMPTFISPHKTQLPASAEDRFNMLKIAFGKMDKIEVSDFEIKKGGTSYTYQTVTHFAERYPDDKIYLIMGGDMLTNFKTWRNPEIITSKATVCVFDRENSNTDFSSEREYFKTHFNCEYIKLNYVGKDFSSTKIRVYSAFGLDITTQTDSGVANYIADKNLYKGNKYIDYVKKTLPQKRLIHTANVVVCALKKYKQLGLDFEKVVTATALHDNAKYLDHTQIEGFVLEEDIPPKVIHSFTGAYIAEKVLGITDGEIIDAIKYHTSGKAEMTTLGKLVFVADMLEEGRSYEGVDKLRKLYDEDFEKCFVECIKEETQHLINAKVTIYKETLNAYEYYVNLKKV